MANNGIKVWLGFEWLRLKTLSRSLHVAAGSGSGKTFGCAKSLLPSVYLRGDVGGVVLDPTRSLCDNFFDWLLKYTDDMPEAEWQRHWSRVRYVDMAATQGYISGWPLLYRLDERESLFEISQRYLETIRRTDPHLLSSSIEGFNAIQKIGTNALMILAALGYQVTEVESLLRDPKGWQSRFDEAIRRYPEVKPAVDFFRQEYMSWKPDARARKIGSLLNKIDMFNKHPIQRALYGTSQPGIDWQEVDEKSLLVFVDVSQVKDTLRRILALMWLDQSAYDYIKWRGSGRHKPFLVAIDELTQMTMHDAQADGVFSELLNEQIAVINRNYSVWGIYMLQSLGQVGEKTRRVLLSCGNHALGVCTDPDISRLLAEEFFPYQPGVEKWSEPVFAGSPPIEIHRRSVPYSVPEWYHQASKHFSQLGRFRFLVRPARAEGDITGPLQMMTLEHIAGNWANAERVAKMRQLLARRDGAPIEQVLAEIDARQRQSDDEFVTLTDEDGQNHDLSEKQRENTRKDHWDDY